MSNREEIISPPVRFKRHLDSWDVSLLGDISRKSTRKNINGECSEVFTNSAEFGVVSQRDFFSHDIANENSLRSYYMVEAGDFVYNPRISVTAPVGPINKNNLGRPGVISPLYYVFKTWGMDPNFLEAFFRSTVWHEFMYQNGNSGARSDRFSIQDEMFRKMPIAHPRELVEQRLIADFINCVEQKLGNAKEVLSQLKQVKKAMLEKMFPKQGATMPEIRFNGFRGSWSRRVAKEIFITSNERNHPELPVISASQTYGMICRENVGLDVAHDKDNERTYKRVRPGDFVIHLRSFQGGFAHSALEGITSPAYTVMRFRELDLHCQYFWKYLLTSSMFIKELEKVTYGIRDGRSISYDEFATLSLLYPNYNEQCKIASYFSLLDERITCAEKKVQKLKQVKKALLERMFV